MEAVGASGAAGSSRRARRQHPVSYARSECPAGRLAPAAALGHQRIACAAGTLVRFREPSVWDRYSVLHPRRRRAAAGADGADRRAAPSAGRDGDARRSRCARSQAELRASYERIRDLGARLLHAQETERSRIARELHDDIGQQMAVLEIDLDLLGRSVPTADRRSWPVSRCTARTASPGACTTCRTACIRPSSGCRPGGGAPGLQRELSQSDVAITFTHDNVPRRCRPM